MGRIRQIPNEQEAERIKQQVEKYWTKRADGFMELRKAELGSNKYERWERELLCQIEARKNGKEGLRILDVGCGCGFFGIILSRHGHHVTGIDLTPAMVECGKRFVKEYGATAELLVMDAEQLEFADETFDVVISRNLTWTLPNGVQAYKEWKRVLKRGGMLINYDAEYAKNDQKEKQRLSKQVHKDIPKDLERECHEIYHMLSASSYERPKWDEEVLHMIGMRNIVITENVGRKIYAEMDRFYVPAPIFRVKAYR